VSEPPAERAADPVGEAFPLWPTSPSPSPEIVPVTVPVSTPVPPAPVDRDQWPAPQMWTGTARRRGPQAGRARPAPRTKRTRRPRRPAVGLLALLLLAPLAGFVAWVSADPFWLSLGRGQAGTATVAGCHGHGLVSRCTGTFTAAGGRFSAKDVALSALPAGAKHEGAQVSAAMVSPRGRMAYAGTKDALRLRWGLGLGLVLLCGLAIAWATGASRLPDRRSRVGGYLTSVAAPLLLLAGIVLAAR
jgi:hypothetical protein